MTDLNVEEAIVVLTRLQRVRYIHAASLVLLVADWAFVFFDEVKYIWRSKWSLIKVLYVLSRFGPYVDTPLSVTMYIGPDISFGVCEKMYKFRHFLGYSSQKIAILILRTTAIYGKSHRILYPLLGLYASIAVAGSIILYLFLNSIVYGPPPVPGLPGCYLADGSTIIFYDFLMLLLFELVVVILTLWKCFHTFRASAPVVRTLYRDSIIFFIVLFGLSLGNLLVLATAPPEYLDLLDTITRVFHSLICCRILLNIRGASAHSGNVQGSDETSRVSRFQGVITHWSTRSRQMIFWRKKVDTNTTEDISLQTFRSSQQSRGAVA